MADRGGQAKDGACFPADTLGEVQRAWETVLPTVCGDVKIETDPQLVKVTGAMAPVVIVCFEITSVNHSGLLSVVYPLTDGLFELRHHFDRKD
jgi:hypothetical protein